jgi:hypothetical protein
MFEGNALVLCIHSAGSDHGPTMQITMLLCQPLAQATNKQSDTSECVAYSTNQVV